MSSQRVTIAIDIECTGGVIGKDMCFAIGVVAGRLDSATGQVEVLEKHRICRPLPLAEDETYQDMWRRCGYELRCYDEFWSKNLETLHKLQTKYLGETAGKQDGGWMAVRFNLLLRALELRFNNNVQYVFDTLNFDPVWINYLLSSINAPSLLYYRDGTYGVDSYELGTYVTAYLSGALGREVEWARDVKPFKQAIAARIPSTVVHDHMPENDAENILYTYLLLPTTALPPK